MTRSSSRDWAGAHRRSSATACTHRTRLSPAHRASILSVLHPPFCCRTQAGGMPAAHLLHRGEHGRQRAVNGAGPAPPVLARPRGQLLQDWRRPARPEQRQRLHALQYPLLRMRGGDWLFCCRVGVRGGGLPGRGAECRARLRGCGGACGHQVASSAADDPGGAAYQRSQAPAGGRGWHAVARRAEPSTWVGWGRRLVLSTS